MERPTRQLVFATGAFIPMLLFMLVMYGGREIGRRPDIEAEQLLIGRADLPTSLGDASTLRQIDWHEHRIRDIDTTSVEGLPYSSMRDGKSWTNTDEYRSSLQVTQSIYRLPSAFSAALAFRHIVPDSQYLSEELTARARTAQQTTVELASLPSSSDQRLTMCAVGEAAACQVWYNWSRYGHFIVQTRLLSVEQPIDVSAFTAVAAATERHVSPQLAPGRTRLFDEARHGTADTVYVMLIPQMAIGLMGGLFYLLSFRYPRFGAWSFGKMWYKRFPWDQQRALRSNIASGVGFLTMGLALGSSVLLRYLPFPEWLDWSIFVCLGISSFVSMVAATVWMAQVVKSFPGQQPTSVPNPLSST